MLRSAQTATPHSSIHTGCHPTFNILLCRPSSPPPSCLSTHAADEAIIAGVPVAVCSTSNERAVSTIVQRMLGPEVAAKMRVFAGDVVKKKKPDPSIYLLAAQELHVEPSRWGRGRGWEMQGRRQGEGGEVQGAGGREGGRRAGQWWVGVGWVRQVRAEPYVSGGEVQVGKGGSR